MIKITCRKCGSPKLRKNGHTKSGRQKFHCKECHFYGTLDLKKDELIEKYKIIEKLHLERISQRGIARITGVSQPTIANILKKRGSQNRDNHWFVKGASCS